MAGIDRRLVALLLVGELSQRQTFARQHFTDFEKAGFAEVLAAEKFRFARASQVANRINTHLLQAISASDAELEVRYRHVEGLSQAIVATLRVLVIKHVASRGRILHVKKGLRMVWVAIQDSLVAHLCLVELVVVFVDQAKIDQDTDAGRECLGSTLVQRKTLIVIPHPIVSKAKPNNAPA